MNSQKDNNKNATTKWRNAMGVPTRRHKQIFALFVLLVAVVAVQSPSFALAEPPPNYVVFKGGYYSPNQNYSVNDFNTAGARSDLESKKGFDGGSPSVSTWRPSSDSNSEPDILKARVHPLSSRAK